MHSTKYFLLKQLCTTILLFSSIVLFTIGCKKDSYDLDSPYYISQNHSLNWDSLLGTNYNYNYSRIGSVGYSTFFMPNIFTPNGDGINDTLIAVGMNIKNYTVTISSLNNSKLFSKTVIGKDSTILFGLTYFTNYLYIDSIVTIKKPYPGINKIVSIPPNLINWDGKNNGKMCAEGFYVVSFSGTTIFGEYFSHSMRIYLWRNLNNVPKDYKNMVFADQYDAEVGNIFITGEKYTIPQ